MIGDIHVVILYFQRGSGDLADGGVAALPALVAAGEDLKAAIGSQANARADAVGDAGAIAGVLIAAGIADADLLVRAGGLGTAILLKRRLHRVESFLKAAAVLDDLPGGGLLTDVQTVLHQEIMRIHTALAGQLVHQRRECCGGLGGAITAESAAQQVVGEYRANVDIHIGNFVRAGAHNGGKAGDQIAGAVIRAGVAVGLAGDGGQRSVRLAAHFVVGLEGMLFGLVGQHFIAGVDHTHWPLEQHGAQRGIDVGGAVLTAAEAAADLPADIV